MSDKTDQVERVAIALFLQEARATQTKQTESDWHNEIGGFKRDLFRLRARAAIKAMQPHIEQCEKTARAQALDDAADMDFEALLDKAETPMTGNRRRASTISDAIHTLK